MKRITYEILTLLLLLSAFSTAGYGNKFAKPDDLLSVVNKEFEIYAPSREDLERASEAVIRARSVYQKYFGKESPKIAVVLYDDAAQTLAFDEAKFQKRGMALLKWKASGIPPKSGVYKELGVILAESPGGGRLQVLAIFVEEPVAGIKLQKDDTFFAVNNRRVASIEDFVREIKAAAVGSPVTLLLIRQGREMELKFNKPPTSKLDAASLAKVQNILQQNANIPTSKTIIAHEAMHELMRAGLNNSAGIPAWFSEGLASLAELPEDLKQHRLSMKENLKESYPLAMLFTMLHPASGGNVAPSEQSQGAAGLPVTVTTNNAKAGIIFYEQSMTLLEFLAETEGERFVGRIGESLAHGESMEKVLSSTKKVLADLVQLNSAWTKWVLSKN